MGMGNRGAVINILDGAAQSGILIKRIPKIFLSADVRKSEGVPLLGQSV